MSGTERSGDRAQTAAPDDGVGRRRHCMVVHARYPLGETRVERQAQALRERGWDVEVIALRESGEPRREEVDGVSVRRLAVRRHKGAGLAVQAIEYLAFFVLASLRLARPRSWRRYACIQVHSPPDALVFAALLPRLAGTPVILDLHDLMPEFWRARVGGLVGTLGRPVIVLAERASCAFATRVVTVTEQWRSCLHERGVPEDKTAVVMNLADPRLFARKSVEPDVSIDGEPTLIYHGLITHRYGLDVLLRALARVRDDGVAARLILHGGGEALPDLGRLAAELGIADRVRFSTSLIATSELPRLIRHADIGVVPYRRDVFTDGILPTKLLEYVALGLPVIATATPAIRSYFDDDMVELVPPNDVDGLAAAIRNLATDPGRRRDLVRGSARFLERHDPALHAEEYATLLDAVARPARPAAR